MEGAEGFIFMYFHLWSLGIRVLLCFTVFLIWDWKGLVGSEVVLRKLLSFRNFSILLVLGCGEYDYGVPLVSSGDRGVVFSEFGSD
jgi:hypothetical protein